VLDRAMGVAGYDFSQTDDRVAAETELEREKALLRHLGTKDARTLAVGRTLFITTKLEILCDPAVDALAGTGTVLLLRPASLQAFNAALIERIQSLGRRREEWSATRANPSALRICDLLGRVRGGATPHEIAEQVRLDPMLSYRILRLANSAALGAAGAWARETATAIRGVSVPMAAGVPRGANMPYHSVKS